MRLDNAKGDMKRSRLERERDRDVSEKVALGLLKGGGSRARRTDLTASSKFAAPERGFAGTAGAGPRSRDKPVQFEAQKEEADPFGLDAFLTDVKNKQ
ncbi:hypothetical protein JL720_12526 [Aureococcus anophagefferens]|nr:hypothetical protein JL720_12526 [Aureococcus anophagefferens]